MSDLRRMSCREVVEVITGYVEGTLPEPQRRRLEAHLDGCAFCETYLEQMREVIARLGTVHEETLSPEAREGLLEAFRGWRDAEAP
jgi:anti-sigma factor RsiW